MARFFAWLLIGCVALPIGLCAAPDDDRHERLMVDRRALARLTPDELIDELVNIEHPGPGYHTHHWCSFTGWYGHSTFGPSQQRLSGPRRILRREPASPVAVELVRRGVVSLPALLKHVDDARPTKLTLDLSKSFNFHFIEHCEYDPRDRQGQLPAGIFSQRQLTIEEVWDSGLPKVTKYRVRVGDVCYALVGDIVNRHLQAVGINPHVRACIISSPVDHPALAAAVRADWKDLSSQEHQRSLVKDIYGSSRSRGIDYDALERLLFYYPREGVEQAVQLLRRQMMDPYRTKRFVEGSLLAEEDPAQWPAMLERFRDEFGPNADDALASQLRSTIDYYQAVLASDRRDAQTQALCSRAEEIVKHLKSARRTQKGALLNLATCEDQARILERVQSYRWPMLDTAAQQLFETLVHAPPTEGGYEISSLGNMCLARLRGKGRIGPLVAHVKRRLAEIEQLPADEWHDEHERERLTAWLKSMRR